jgi:hypothetical protein
MLDDNDGINGDPVVRSNCFNLTDDLMLPFLAANRQVTSLSVLGDNVRFLPLRAFDNVVSLDVDGDSDGVALVLKHLTLLQCLDIRDANFAVFEALVDVTGKLAALQSFSLLMLEHDDESDMYLDNSHTDILAAFVKSLPVLKRLNLAIYTSDDLWIELLTTLPNLAPRMTALGISFSLIVNGAVLSAIATNLSPSIRALSLTLPWETGVIDALEFSPLVSRFVEKFQHHSEVL